MRAQKSFVKRVLFRRHCIGIDDAMAHISGCSKKGVCAPARMGAAAATAGNAAGVGGNGAGDMQRGGGGGDKSRDYEDGPQHRRAEEGSEALTGSSKVAEAWLRWSRTLAVSVSAAKYGYRRPDSLRL